MIGYSHSRNKILTVILVHREDGGYWGCQRLGVQLLRPAAV